MIIRCRLQATYAVFYCLCCFLGFFFFALCWNGHHESGNAANTFLPTARLQDCKIKLLTTTSFACSGTLSSLYLNVFVSIIYS